MQEQKNLQEVLPQFAAYLGKNEMNILSQYNEAGEDGLAFDLMVNHLLQGDVPLTKELSEWVQWYGSETEKLGGQLDPAWKKVKFEEV